MNSSDIWQLFIPTDGWSSCDLLLLSPRLVCGPCLSTIPLCEEILNTEIQEKDAGQGDSAAIEVKLDISKYRLSGLLVKV